MSDGMWLEGERQLFLNMQKRIDGAEEASRRGIRVAAMNILADAKENLRKNKSVVTGQLRASGKTQDVQSDPDAIDVGFFSQTQGGYAAYVEYGRRAGKFPPLSYIVQWVRKKFRKSEKEAKSIGFLIARSIARKGTRPHPFFGPAIQKNENAITKAIAAEMKKETDKDA